MQFSKRFGLIALAAMLAALAGCAGEAPADQASESTSEATTQQAGGAEGGEALSGDVAVDGSSTVFPITTAVAEEFQTQYPDVRVTVGLSGTGGGFEKFCNGETDISDASRPIKGAEAEACAANGIEYTEFMIGVDGLTVVVNPANDWVQCLTIPQLVQIFGSSGAAYTWADINPDWPAEPITLFVPDPDSGTRDYMIEVLERADQASTDLRSSDTVTASADDNQLVTGVSNEQYAIGFFGYAYYVEAGDAIRAVAIENGEGECVEPSNETVQNGTYNPLSRPLFIYANNASLREKPWVAEFVRFFLSTGAETVMSDVGYSLPPDGTYDEGLSALDAVLNP